MTPFWEEGLNTLELYGLSCTVVPHFNNKEGGNHDTSCSYIGKNRLNMLINEEYTNILGIDEHTALVINGEKEIFSVDGIGSVTVKTSNGQKVFEAGNEYSLSELQSILQSTNKRELQHKKASSDNIDVNSLKKEIAKLNLEIKNNNDFTTLFDKTILEIINLRNKFRIEKKYSESDEIRDLLDNLDIAIEDNKTGSSWKFKDQ
jgi:hypothetical protein